MSERVIIYLATRSDYDARCETEAVFATREEAESYADKRTQEGASVDVEEWGLGDPDA